MPKDSAVVLLGMEVYRSFLRVAEIVEGVGLHHQPKELALPPEPDAMHVVFQLLAPRQEKMVAESTTVIQYPTSLANLAGSPGPSEELGSSC